MQRRRIRYSALGLVVGMSACVSDTMPTVTIQPESVTPELTVDSLDADFSCTYLGHGDGSMKVNYVLDIAYAFRSDSATLKRIPIKMSGRTELAVAFRNEIAVPVSPHETISDTYRWDYQSSVPYPSGAGQIQIVAQVSALGMQVSKDCTVRPY